MRGLVTCHLVVCPSEMVLQVEDRKTDSQDFYSSESMLCVFKEKIMRTQAGTNSLWADVEVITSSWLPVWENGRGYQQLRRAETNDSQHQSTTTT